MQWTSQKMCAKAPQGHMRASEPIVAHTGTHQRQHWGRNHRKNCRFQKWSGALGQLVNMVKWVMEDARSAFRAHGPAFLHAVWPASKASKCLSHNAHGRCPRRESAGPMGFWCTNACLGGRPRSSLYPDRKTLLEPKVHRKISGVHA